jgi:hypothetical protein
MGHHPLVQDMYDQDSPLLWLVEDDVLAVLDSSRKFVGLGAWSAQQRRSRQALAYESQRGDIPIGLLDSPGHERVGRDVLDIEFGLPGVA